MSGVKERRGRGKRLFVDTLPLNMHSPSSLLPPGRNFQDRQSYEETKEQWPYRPAVTIDLSRFRVFAPQVADF